MNSPAPTPLAPSAYRFIFLALFAGFVLSGIVGTINGPLLPSFIARWALDDSAAGLFITVFYVGSFAGTFLSSALIAGKGYRLNLVVGFAIMALGVFSLRAPGLHFALAATSVYGFGYGLVVPGTNLWVAENSGERRAAALNISNLAWGTGAMVCPLLVLYAVRAQHTQGLLLAVSLLVCALSGVLAFSPFGPHVRTAKGESASGNEPTPGLGVAIALGVLFLVYVGTENGMSLWAAEHAKRVLVNDNASWALAPTLFFTGLLGGRAAASVILLKLREEQVVYGGLIIAAFGGFAALSAHHRLILLGGELLAGLGLSGVYPIFIAWLAKWFGVHARKLGGVMFALAAGGGMTLPWIVGAVSKAAGNLRIGLGVPVACCALMLATVWWARRRVARYGIVP